MPLKKVFAVFICILLVFAVPSCNEAPRNDVPVAGKETGAAVEELPIRAAGAGATAKTDSNAGPAPAGGAVPGLGEFGETAVDRESAPGGNARASMPAEPGAPGAFPPAAGTGNRVFLHVTRDYGREILFSREVGCRPGDTVLDILDRNLEVQTAYGGGFVSGIAGLESGYTGRTWGREKKDWLYWVNGVAAAVGPAQYRPRPGDYIWWDYQDWSAGQMANAVVGAFPQPFVNGYGSGAGGALVLHPVGYEAEAALLESVLRKHGVGSVRTTLLDQELVRQREKPTLVVGAWEHLGDVPDLAHWNDQGPRGGVYLRLAVGEVLRLGPDGRETGRHGAGTGVLWAVGNGPGDRAPLFMVTGADRAGVRAAVELLVREPFRCRGTFALVVTGQDTVRVP